MADDNQYARFSTDISGEDNPYTRFLQTDTQAEDLGGRSAAGIIAERVKQAWENPPPGPSLIGMAKQAYGALQLPGDVAAGRVTAMPGLRREDITDMPGSSQPQDPVIRGATEIAGLVTSTPFSSAGSVGSGVVIPRMVSKPVQAAESIGVGIPRFLASESMAVQRAAAGLKNIPGVGDKLIKSTEQTTQALGEAARTAQEGYGTGNASLAGTQAREAIKNWIENESADIASRAYGRVDPLIESSTTRPLAATQQAAGEITARNLGAALPPGRAVEMVREAIGREGGLTYEGAKTLRSRVGELIDRNLIPEGASPAEFKQIYGALTDDLKGVISEAGGPAALKQWERANNLYAQIAEKRDLLKKIVGAKGDIAPEAVFARLSSMASNKSSADIQRLALARKAMGSEAWDEIASSIVNGIGRDAEGKFSPERYLTAYGKLSYEGKRLLFRSTGKGELASSLDNIAAVSSAIKDRISKFENTSKTSQNVNFMAQIVWAFSDPLSFLAARVGGHAVANALARPASASQISKWSNIYKSSVLAPSQSKRIFLEAATRNLTSRVFRGDEITPQPNQ